MKFAKTFVAVLLAAVLAPSAFAQSANKQVDVTATLTSVCRFSAAGNLTIAAAYTAFGAAIAPTGTAAVECTRHTTAPTFTFDNTLGVVKGLVFQLSSAWTETSAGTDPDGSSIAMIGTARTGNVTVTASFPAGQAGTGTSGAATVSRTLTVAF